MKQRYLKILDIGHSGNSPDEAMTILETTVSQCSFENKTKAIKVITGHGSGRLRQTCLLYTSPSPRDRTRSRMPSSA